MTYSRCLLLGGVALLALSPLVLASCGAKPEAAAPNVAATAAVTVAPNAATPELVAASPAQTVVKPKVVKAAAKAKSAAKPDDAKLGVVGKGLYFVLPDPKAPGKLLLKLWAGGLNGSFSGNGVQGDLNKVTAILYQHGTASAKMSAPIVNGNNMQNVLVAKGRVTVTSLAQPGSVMRADRMTWYAKKNQIIADGNVYYHDGKYGATLNAPHLIADTLLKKIYTQDALHGSVR